MLEVTPLNSQIVQVLKEEILSGSLQPNQKISIEELAHRFGVSSTPVRDALRTLETTGFVIVSPRKSITVASLDEKAIKDVFDLRTALECCAVELSIDNIPPKIVEKTLQANYTALEKYNASENPEYLRKLEDIHDIILEYCNNHKLISIMDDLRSLIMWARGTPIGQPKSYPESVIEHIKILEHIKSKERELAVQAMRSHLIASCERTLGFWKENINFP